MRSRPARSACTRTSSSRSPTSCASAASSRSHHACRTGLKEAGGGNRTRVISLEGWSSTIELHPRVPSRLASVLLAHTHSPYAWQADVDTTVVVPGAVAALPLRRRTCRCAALANRLLRGLDGAARGRVLVADPSPGAALPAHGAPAAERDPRRMGAAPRRARRVAADGRAARPHAMVARSRRTPRVALPLWVGNYFFWHAPPVYDAALRHQEWLIHVEHGCYFATGILFWWPLVQDVPRQLRLRHAGGLRLRRVRARGAARSPAGARCRSPHTTSTCTRRACGGSSPITDQQIAGVTMASRTGGRPLRRLPLLVPPLPRRGGRYLRQPVTRSRSGWLQWVCQSRTAFWFWTRTSLMPTFSRGEPAVGVGDVVGILNRLAEDERQEVVARVDLHRTAGGGARDEVERAAEPHRLRLKAGLSSSRANRCAAELAPATGHDHRQHGRPR